MAFVWLNGVRGLLTLRELLTLVCCEGQRILLLTAGDGEVLGDRLVTSHAESSMTNFINGKVNGALFE